MFISWIEMFILITFFADEIDVDEGNTHVRIISSWILRWHDDKLAGSSLNSNSSLSGFGEEETLSLQ